MDDLQSLSFDGVTGSPLDEFYFLINKRETKKFLLWLLEGEWIWFPESAEPSYKNLVLCI